MNAADIHHSVTAEMLAEQPPAPPRPETAGFLEADPLVADYLASTLKTNRLAHGLIFSGPYPALQVNTALALAQVLNCQNRNPDAPFYACGQCGPCHWVQSNRHPEVITLSPLTGFLEEAGTGGGQQIRAKQIDALVGLLGKAPTGTGWRVVIVTGAEETATHQPEPHAYPLPPVEGPGIKYVPLLGHMLNVASANRLLKFLEEPPPRVLFVFIAEDAANLLATIVSRCQTVPFRQPAQTLVSRYAFDDEDKTLLARLADGGMPPDAWAKALAAQCKLAGLEPAQWLDAATATLEADFHPRYREAPAPEARRLFRRLRHQLAAMALARRQLLAKVHVQQTLSVLAQHVQAGPASASPSGSLLTV